MSKVIIATKLYVQHSRNRGRIGLHPYFSILPLGVGIYVGKDKHSLLITTTTTTTKTYTYVRLFASQF